MENNFKTFNISEFDIKNPFKFEYNNDETKKIKERFSDKNKKISLDDLRRVSLWKLNRVLDIEDKTIEKINIIRLKEDLKYNENIVIEIINELKKSSGVGFPMLSSFLKFLRPDIFPIIDIRAYRALYGKKIIYGQYSIEKYFDYIKKVYEIQEKTGLELYQVDEQLYCFDRDYNGKI